jgi:SPP1 gp7 family putative phage head morphogenesis protein
MAMTSKKDLNKIRLDALKKTLIEKYTNLGKRLSISEVNRMLEDDSIQTAINSIRLALQSANITIDCDNARQKDFIESQLSYYYSDLVNLYIDCLIYGYNFREVIYDKDKYWGFSEFRDVRNLNQVKPLYYNGELVGFRVDQAEIPLYKSFWSAYKASYQNPRGDSLLRGAHRAWFYKNILITSMAQFYEQRGTPLMHIEYPPNPKVYDTDNESERKDANLESAREIADNIHTEKYVITPATRDEELSWEFNEVIQQDRGATFLEPINILDRMIQKALLMPDSLMSAGDSKGGSFALSQTQNNIRSQFLDGIANEFFREITNTTYGILWSLSLINFGKSARPIQISHSSFGDKSDILYKQILDKLIQSPTYNVPIDPNDILEKLDIPIVGNSEFTKIELSSKKEKLTNIQRVNQRRATLRDEKLEDIFKKNKAGLVRKAYSPLEDWLNDNSGKYYSKYKNNPQNAELEIPRSIQATIADQWNTILLVVFLSGLRDVQEHAVRASETNLEKINLAKVEIDKWYNKKPEQVIDIFRSQIGLEYELYNELLEYTETRAFSLAIANSKTVANRFKRSLTTAIDKGMSKKAWRESVKNELIPSLGMNTQKDHYLNTVYRTNIANAYNSGNWAARQSDFVNKVLPALQYCAVGDDRTRPSHFAQDGTIYPVKHDYWNNWYPPNGFNCRCYTIDVTANDYKDIGENPPKQQLPPDKGFSGNVGKQWIEEMTSIPMQEIKDKYIVEYLELSKVIENNV